MLEFLLINLLVVRELMIWALDESIIREDKKVIRYQNASQGMPTN